MYYGESKDLVQGGYTDYNVNKSQSVYSAPTLNHVQKWLRERHSINVFVLPNRYDGDQWYYVLGFHLISHDRTNMTYEEALEEGLFQALKLIK